MSGPLKMENASPEYGKVKLIEPTGRGYLYIAASIDPGQTPFILPSRKRSRLLARLKDLAQRAEQLHDVVAATVFRAIVTPPTARFSNYLKARSGTLNIADFDVIVLIEARSPQAANDLKSDATVSAIISAMRGEAKTMCVIAAKNIKRIGDINRTRDGLFLFNHFAADEARVMRELWDHLAQWYVVNTGLDNSIALAPLEGESSDYAIINWARWDSPPLLHFANMLARPSFWSYVAHNLDVNHAASMPIYCRLA